MKTQVNTEKINQVAAFVMGCAIVSMLMLAITIAFVEICSGNLHTPNF
jgi:hypothetical protein